MSKRAEKRRKRAKQRHKENTAMRYSATARERRQGEASILADSRHDQESRIDAEKLLGHPIARRTIKAMNKILGGK
jgi:hypothetical protein